MAECDLLADFKCFCGFLCCNNHLGGHILDNPNHKPSQIILPLSDEEISAIQTVGNTQVQSAILHQIKNKNVRIDRLLRRIKCIEDECSLRVETILRNSKEILSVFKEIEER